MKIKFTKDFMAAQSDDYRDLHAILIKRGGIVDVDGCEYNGSHFDMPKEQAQWLIDNGFAEEVKEPEWVRKQIKNIKYRYKGCFEVIKFRYIKDFYVCSFDNRSNEEVSKWNKGFEDEFDIYNGRYSSAEKLSYLNQLVRDGYIEIEDSPNIVWEDEDD